MNFSIVLASRERTELLYNLIKSVQETTDDLNNVELLVAIDDDDVVSQNFKEKIKEYSFVRIYSRPRTTMLNRDYLNWLHVHFATGKYSIICNDDTLFKTPKWDQIAFEKLEKYLSDKPDGIVYGFISDTLLIRAGGLNYSCFPLISRKGADALGFAIPPQFAAWSADIELFKIYSAIDRVCDLSEIMIQHVSYHSGLRKKDKINLYVAAISNYPTINIQHYTELLNKEIRKSDSFQEISFL